MCYEDRDSDRPGLPLGHQVGIEIQQWQQLFRIPVDSIHSDQLHPGDRGQFLWVCGERVG